MNPDVPRFSRTMTMTAHLDLDNTLPKFLRPSNLKEVPSEIDAIRR